MQTFSRENILRVLSSSSSKTHQHHENAGTLKREDSVPNEDLALNSYLLLWQWQNF